MNLMELFDRPYRWTRERSAPYLKTATFHTEDGREFHIQLAEAEDGIWDLVFVEGHGVNMQTRPTGEGDALRVYATVVDFVRSVVRSEGIVGLTFSADSRRQERLYDRLARLFMKEFDWRLRARERVDGKLTWEIGR